MRLAGSRDRTQIFAICVSKILGARVTLARTMETQLIRRGIGGRDVSLRFGRLAEALATVLEACVNERCKQRMRSQWLRFELGVKLAADEPGVSRDFHDFDVDAVRSAAGDAESSARERVFIFAIKLIAVTVTLGDIGAAISLVGERAGLDFAGPGAEAHRSAHFVDAE